MALTSNAKSALRIAVANQQAGDELCSVLDTSSTGLASQNVTTGYKVNNIQVVGAQGAAIANVTPATDGTAVGTAFNTLLARLRAHGLIAP